MAQGEKVPTFLLFELGHFRNDIAANNGRVVPIGLSQRRREDEFLHGIEPDGPTGRSSTAKSWQSSHMCSDPSTSRRRPEVGPIRPSDSVVAVTDESQVRRVFENAVDRDEGVFDDFSNELLLTGMCGRPGPHRRAQGSSAEARPEPVCVLTRTNEGQHNNLAAVASIAAWDSAGRRR